jgi:GT2 family glycosyltransferase
MDDTPPRLIGLQAHGDGALELIHDRAGEDDAYLVRDETGMTWSVSAVREVIGRDIGLDLLDAADNAMPPWRLRDGPDLALDLDPARLGGAEAWLWPAAGGEIVHRDPLGGGRTPIRAGAHYRLRLDVSLGADAVLWLICFDADGARLRGVEHAVAAGEAEVRARFTAPPGAVELEIALAGPGDVRLGRPQFAEVAPHDKEVRVLRLRRWLLEDRRRGWNGQTARVRLALPARLLDGEAHNLSVVVRSAEHGWAAGEVAFRYAPQIQVAKQGIERASLVRLVGRLADPIRRYLDLQVRIDGVAGPIHTIKAAANGKFDARLPIPRDHLDGRLHRIEVREAETQAVVFAANEATAAFLARWPTLQQWAQPPLSPESSPAAGRHRKALAVWAERAARGEAIPPVGPLHQELLGGVRRRSAWPPIAFAQAAAPRVSVVVPAHDKFEVTYLGLCALLFAPNDLAFEVIVVDDGSSDETARIEEIVSGVRVVRHATGEGFVAACNDGAAAACGELLVFLNNDTEVTAGWLDALAAAFERFPDVGLTGAKLIYPDGRLQEAGGIVWGTGDPWNAGRGGDADHPMWNYPRQVDYLSGAAIMIPRAIWDEVGGFGPEWAPAYFEDTDLAFKVRASGRRAVYVPAAEVYHYEGLTAGVVKTEGTKRFQELNRPKFKEKWKALYAAHGPVVGERPDLEKDRAAVLRVVVVVRAYPDGEIPQALFDLLRTLQGQGAKVTLLPWDLTWRPIAGTIAAMGVESQHAPYVEDPAGWLQSAAADLDAVVAFDVDPDWLRGVLGGVVQVARADAGGVSTALAAIGVEGLPGTGFRYLPDEAPRG